MKHYNWYIVNKALKLLQVKSRWVSPSDDLLAFAGPKGMAVMRKSNHILPETIQLLLDELGIDIADFERACETLTLDSGNPDPDA